jgi:hypothetical protein
MFNKLFHHPRVISRHANAPLAHERITFLSHLTSRGTPNSTLLCYARQLRVISTMLGRPPDLITRQEISLCAKRWARRQRRLRSFTKFEMVYRAFLSGGLHLVFIHGLAQA